MISTPLHQNRWLIALSMTVILWGSQSSLGLGRSKVLWSNLIGTTSESAPLENAEGESVESCNEAGHANRLLVPLVGLVQSLAKLFPPVTNHPKLSCCPSIHLGPLAEYTHWNGLGAPLRC